MASIVAYFISYTYSYDLTLLISLKHKFQGWYKCNEGLPLTLMVIPPVFIIIFHLSNPIEKITMFTVVSWEYDVWIPSSK